MSEKGAVKRSRFVVLSYIVQKELMATLLRLNGVEIDKHMVERAVVAVKTLAVGKHIELKKNVQLHSEKQRILLNVEVDGV